MSNKKKTTSKNQPDFNDVLERFQRSDFVGGTNLLKKAKIQSQEAGKAKQLKAAILNQMALQQIHQKNYKGAIDLLQPGLLTTEKPGFPLPYDHTHLLMGISYLYLGQYKDAVDSLAKAKKLPESSLYYLLALIHYNQSEDSTYESFYQKHQLLIQTLPKDKVPFLQLTWNLVRGALDHANTLLEGLDEPNEFVRGNIQVLKTIIKRQGQLDAMATKQAKTIYKVLAGQKPDMQEELYLNHFEEFEEFLFKEDGKRQQEYLKSKLSEMCLEGVPLSDEDFEKIFKQTRNDHKPFLVYNQVANIYNESLDADSFPLSRVMNYLKTYGDYLMQVAESGELILRIADHDPHNFSVPLFWKFIQIYLNRIAMRDDMNQLNRLGWRIMSILEYGNFVTKNERLFVEICKQHPDIIAFRLFATLHAVHETKFHIPVEVKSLFNYDLSKYEPEIAGRLLSFLASFTLVLSEDLADGEYYLPKYKKDNFFLDFYARLVVEIRDTMIKFPVVVNPDFVEKVVIILQLFFDKTVKEFEVTVDDKVKEKLNQAYMKILEISQGDKLENTLQRIQSEKERAGLLGDVDGLFKRGGDMRKLTEYLDRLTGGADHQLIVKQLLKAFDREHYNEAFLIPRAMVFFTILVEKKLDNETELLSDFLKQYWKLGAEMNCEHPVEFACTWLTELLNIENKDYWPAVATMVNGIYLELTKEEIPQCYNTIDKALRFYIKAIEKYPDFIYDKSVITTMTAYLMYIVKIKKLKGINKTVEKAKDFFADRIN